MSSFRRSLCGFFSVCMSLTVIAEPTTQHAQGNTAEPNAAHSILDQAGKAYHAAKSLSFTGKLSLDFDAGGEQKHESADFTASFVAPNRFRHEIKDDVLIVATGEKLFAYLPGKNEYVSVDPPKERVDPKELSESITTLLGAQNPVLLMAIAKEPMDLLTANAKNLKQSDDVKLGNVAFNSVTFDKADHAYRVLVDPSTHFIRQVRIDRKAEVQKRGVEDVKTADVTFDYLTTKAGEVIPPEQFAFAPPRDATVAKEEAEESPAGEASALEGKPAPDFKLTALDGSEVSLADLKGSVVVLDFWATWCGPCVAALPHIDQIHTDMKEKGVKVFAVNIDEPKAAVEKFIAAKKLGLPVLLDTGGAIGKKYLANAIPETVVIGKDGVVLKVFVGFSGDEPLRNAIAEALKK